MEKLIGEPNNTKCITLKHWFSILIFFLKLFIIAYIFVLAANSMLPKNSETFCKGLKLLMTEAEEILNDQTLRTNFKELSIRKNIFRSKCLNFLSISFDNSDNSYTKEFEENFPEVSQLHLSIFTNGSTPAPFSFSFENLEFAKHLFEKYLQVNAFTNSIINDLPTQVTDEGLFFKGEYYDAIYHLDKIISQASNEIKIVDNYISFDLITFLTNRKANIALKILTTSNNITSLKLALQNFQKQYSNITIKESSSYHDRFLILDNLHLYHFGASLKDLGNKTFMFSKINEPNIIQAFITDFDREWNSANQLFP